MNIHQVDAATVAGACDPLDGLTNADDAFALVPVCLLRPHRTLTRCPHTSSPAAHASAARSADSRSVKFTNAHLSSPIQSQATRNEQRNTSTATRRWELPGEHVPSLGDVHD